MAYEIESYVPNPDGEVDLGFPSGRGAPTFPPNYDRGKDLGPALGNGAELSWATDIRDDPAGNGADPAEGWKRGVGIGGAQA